MDRSLVAPGRLAVEQAGQQHHLVRGRRDIRVDERDPEVVVVLALHLEAAADREVDDRRGRLPGVDLAVDQQAGFADRDPRRREGDRNRHVGVVRHDLASWPASGIVPGARPAYRWSRPFLRHQSTPINRRTDYHEQPERRQDESAELLAGGQLGAVGLEVRLVVGDQTRGDLDPDGHLLLGWQIGLSEGGVAVFSDVIGPHTGVVLPGGPVKQLTSWAPPGTLR